MNKKDKYILNWFIIYEKKSNSSLCLLCSAYYRKLAAQYYLIFYQQCIEGLMLQLYYLCRLLRCFCSKYILYLFFCLKVDVFICSIKSTNLCLIPILKIAYRTYSQGNKVKMIMKELK